MSNTSPVPEIFVEPDLTAYRQQPYKLRDITPEKHAAIMRLGEHLFGKPEDKPRVKPATMAYQQGFCSVG